MISTVLWRFVVSSGLAPIVPKMQSKKDSLGIANHKFWESIKTANPLPPPNVILTLSVALLVWMPPLTN